MDATVTQPSPRQGYFSVRWHGHMPWRVFFWRDLMVIGTLANACLGFLALVMLASGADVLWALAVHAAPLPYNLFMLGVVWRWPGLPPTWKWVAVVWFAVMLVI
jgi:hypothetical protein